MYFITYFWDIHRQKSGRKLKLSRFGRPHVGLICTWHVVALRHVLLRLIEAQWAFLLSISLPTALIMPEIRECITHFLFLLWFYEDCLENHLDLTLLPVGLWADAPDNNSGEKKLENGSVYKLEATSTAARGFRNKWSSNISVASHVMQNCITSGSTFTWRIETPRCWLHKLGYYHGHGTEISSKQSSLFFLLPWMNCFYSLHCCSCWWLPVHSQLRGGEFTFRITNEDTVDYIQSRGTQILHRNRNQMKPSQ